LCIKLVSIKEIYYNARPTKSQDLHCKTTKTDIPLQEDQNKIVQKQRGHLVEQKRNLILCNLYKKNCVSSWYQ